MTFVDRIIPSGYLFRNLLQTKISVKTNFRITPKPLILIWESFNRCNANCAYCNLRGRDGSGEKILSETEARALIDQSAALGVSCFSISGGGEPLLRKDIGRNIAYCKKKGMFVALTTNGHLIKNENRNDILKADIVTISLDSLNPETNRRRRGNEKYLQKTMEGIQTLVRNKKNTYLCVQAVIDEENWREINEFNKYFYSMGVDTLFQPLYNHNFNIPRLEWAERIRKLNYINPLTKWIMKPYMKRFPQIADGSWKGSCLAGSISFVVSAQGRFMACHLRREFTRDLRKTSLLTAWRELREVRKKLYRHDRGCVCGDTAILPYSMVVDLGKSYRSYTEAAYNDELP